MTTKLKDAENRRKIAEHDLAVIRAQVEAKSLEGVLRLVESPQPVRVPWQEYPAYDEFNRPNGAYALPWTSIDDRSGPRFRPYYENALDLRRIRAEARRFEALFPVAQGILSSLANYIFGSGFEFTAQAKSKQATESEKQLVRQVQAAIDEFVELNDVTGGLDRQLHDRSRVDGEAFPTLYPEGPKCRLELVEPDAITEPVNKGPLERFLRTSHKINHWWHGVHTCHNLALRRDDVQRPLGYHAVFDSIGDEWDYLPASRCEHVQRNVYGRRGVSDYFAVCDDLENEAKLRRNTAVGAAIQAAIAFIREHVEGASKSSIERMVSTNATNTVDRLTDSGTRTTNVEQMRPGVVKDIPAGMKYHAGPLGELRSPVYIEVAQYVIRILGNRWNMPEYMSSGDASNANFASTLVAESPFVKAREADQAFYGRTWHNILWKMLRLVCEAGRFGRITFEQLWAVVKLKIDYPDVASRDRVEQATVAEILHRNGLLSRRTWATMMDLDLDEELSEIAKEPPPVQTTQLPVTQPAGQDPAGDGEATQQVPPDVRQQAAELPGGDVDLRLNGDQITAAIDVLKSVSTGELPKIAAVELLKGIGIDGGRANAMASAADLLEPPPTEAPPPVTESMLESLAVKAYERLMEGAA